MYNLVYNFKTWQSSLRRDLHKFALSDNWDLARSIYSEYPHMLTMELTTFHNITLYVAIEWSSSDFCGRVIKHYEHRRPRDSKLRWRHSILCCCSCGKWVFASNHVGKEWQSSFDLWASWKTSSSLSYIIWVPQDHTQFVFEKYAWQNDLQGYWIVVFHDH